MPDVGPFRDHIDAQEAPGQADRAIAALAARQHGIVSRRQLTDFGLGDGAISHRLRAGRLHSVHRGVYAVGHCKVTGRGRWMAAVLACGEGAALSHRSAGALSGIAPAGAAHIDVTAPGRKRHSRGGLAVHRVRSLHRDDRTEIDGIPVTTVPRTLLDLAEVVDARRLERAFEEAERLRLPDIRAIEGTIARNPGRRGLKPLLALLRRVQPVPETRSELERRFVTFCHDAGLPPPALNAIVEGFEVDAVWKDRRLVVELDGYEFHRTRGAFERDRARDAALQIAGYRVLRVTSRRLGHEPGEIKNAIRSLLA